LKNKALIITIVVFFLLVNTTYYWEGKLGLFAIPVLILLIAVYVGLAVALLPQLYFSFKEKFRKKERLLTIALLATVLGLTYYRPFGLIDFERFEGNDVLVAEREGSANCMTTLKLKDDFTFKERTVCFGMTELKGTFRIVQDTIYFDNTDAGRQVDKFYKFAVIKPTKFSNHRILGDIVMYENADDTAGHILWITRNELHKLENSKTQPASKHASR
jgi:hypothetical protein